MRAFRTRNRGRWAGLLGRAGTLSAASLLVLGLARGAEPRPTPPAAPTPTTPAAPTPGAPPADPGKPATDPKVQIELPKVEDGPKPATETSPDAAKKAAARQRVQSVPEIGQCRREPLAGQSALDDLKRDKPKYDPSKFGPERVEFDKVATRFFEVAEEYRQEVDTLLEGTFKERMDGVVRRYDRQTNQIELTERERRNDAIAQFERFIEKYPKEPRYTPDAMFRLAELYYERSAVDYEEATNQYNEQKALYDRGKIPEKPPSPVRGYDDIIRTYQKLLANFGDAYRYADAVYYLLGYVLQEAEDDIGARKVWMELVSKHPKSDYAPEVFLRIGENHFDYGEFELAAEAYQKALAYTESRFYDKALYKLAWTYFQVFDYDKAIKTFKDLIAYYDKTTQGTNTASALRDEAIEYLAKSLAEDDWDNDGVEDANRGIARALGYLQGGTRWEKEIIARYAEALYDLHDIKKYAESIEVYRRLIAMEPTALKAVDFQQKIIQIFDVLRDVENSTRERQRLAEMFAPGSQWARANQSEAKRIAEASEAVEVEMRRRALTLHQRAQELKAEAKDENKPALLADAVTSYRSAARAYQEYLARYPAEPASYEMRFYLAESLYYSEQYREAAATYLETAGDPYQSRFREPAAWSAVKAYEKILQEAVASGKIPPKSNPSASWEPEKKKEGDQGADPKKVDVEAYPQEIKDWLAAIDFYVLRDISKEGSKKPQVAFAYQAASIAARFHDLEDARTRFRQVIACFPDDDLAADAMANILNTYREENDLLNLERWATIADRIELGDPEVTAEIQKQIKVFKLGAQFQRAESLLAASRHLEAAKEFERLADQNQDAAFVDKAYYNAAMAYKEVKYYDSAARIFERLVNDQRFAKSEFKTESVFELAENYKLFFSFEKSTEAYFMFLQRTEGTTNANRPYALYTAARLQEYSGKLKEAAATYERYADTFKNREDSANALFRSAELYEKLSDREQQKRVLASFITRFGTAQGMASRVLDAMMRLGDLATAQGKVKDATKYYGDVVREYQARGFQPGTQAAAAAAKARFMLVERQFEEYVKLRLTGTSQRKMGADIARKKKLLDELEVAYGEVLPYKALDWTIAASYRAGDIYRDFADTLYKAPEPQGLSDEELEAYVNIIEDEGLKYENIAIERFERTVNESRRLKVTTEWAEKALEAINKYKPEQYPLFKEAKRAATFTPRFRIDARAESRAQPKSPDGPPPTPDGTAPKPPDGTAPKSPDGATTPPVSPTGPAPTVPPAGGTP